MKQTIIRFFIDYIIFESSVQNDLFEQIAWENVGIKECCRIEKGFVSDILDAKYYHSSHTKFLNTQCHIQYVNIKNYF